MRESESRVIAGPTLLTDQDIYLFREGTHSHLYGKLGATLRRLEGRDGVQFAVWAPNAQRVTVVGDFNGWNRDAHPLAVRLDSSGIWEGFIPGVPRGCAYKYYIESAATYYSVLKADPFAFRCEVPPRTASIVWDVEYEWNDREWMSRRAGANDLSAPMSIYEVHLGSWQRVPEEGGRFLTYLEMAERLVPYVKEMGFTHVEMLPIMEHPFYGSWGYQVTGFFAPTSRYGTPQDFMRLVDAFHQNGIGVILDWVPSHFPCDEHGLHFFDGTNLYEHQDPRLGLHPDWNSCIFNYGRNEIRNFLNSSAQFWLDKYHIDGLRVDAVASMLCLDYSRQPGEWIPNRYGGNENLDAISFIKKFNESVYQFHPDCITIAEESTAWPMVSRPVYLGGLGFGLKWKMGWMHDTLRYLSKDPIHRKHHHESLAFSIWYAFWENYVLPLSHDEMVHGKKSLLARMPGDDWQKSANLRLLFGYMFTHPGKKLLFMGGEWGQWNEWYHETSLDWHLLQHPTHQGIKRWVQDLNRALIEQPALHELDFHESGFQWIDFRDIESSILSYMRKGRTPGTELLVVCNFTPVVRNNYRAGVPNAGRWKEILNSDAACYGGSGVGNMGGAETSPIECHGFPQSVSLTLPPLGAVVLRWAGNTSVSG